MGDIAYSKQIEIEASRAAILAGLRSGDLVEQCHSCEKLCILAENYSPRQLENAIVVTAAFNRLDSQIRLNALSEEAQGVISGKLVATAVNVLAEIIRGTDEVAKNKPISILSLPTEYKEGGSSPSPSQQGGAPPVDDSDDTEAAEKAVLRFIVNKLDPDTKGKLIAAMGLSKKYGNSDFHLQDISMELHRGEILGIVGVNASGKTTLLRMLLGELRPTTGMISYPAFNQDAHRPHWKTIKRRIAYVSQTLPR